MSSKPTKEGLETARIFLQARRDPRFQQMDESCLIAWAADAAHADLRSQQDELLAALERIAAMQRPSLDELQAQATALERDSLAPAQDIARAAIAKARGEQ